MSEHPSELKNIVEAALLVSSQPLTIEKLLSMFPEGGRPERDEIRQVLDELSADYAERGVELKQIDHGYRFQSREKYSDWLSRLTYDKPQRYSRALLETLSIITYRQPVTRSDIEDIRGVSISTEMIRTLLERDWIRQVGHRDVPGKPALFGTTRTFLEHFNLKSLDELPPLSELRSIDEISRGLDAVVRVPEKNTESASGPDSEQKQLEQEEQGDAPNTLNGLGAEADEDVVEMQAVTRDNDDYPKRV